MQRVKDVADISAAFSRARERFSMLLRSEAIDFSIAAAAVIALALQSVSAKACARVRSASVSYLPGSERTNCCGSVVAAGAQAARARSTGSERSTDFILKRKSAAHL